MEKLIGSAQRQLARFPKEEPYGTTEQDIGLHPWLLASVGFRDSAEQLGMSPGPGLEMIGLKEANIACSIITAENSVLVRGQRERGLCSDGYLLNSNPCNVCYSSFA